MRIRSFVSRHKAVVGTGAGIGLGLLIFALVWFQPQKIFIEDTVEEAAPDVVPMATTAGTSSPAETDLPSGEFRSLEHETIGSARLIRVAAGSYVVRLEDLDTSNGPDLRVYLSELPPNLGWHDYGERFVDLGALKGNRGDQNYAIPPSVDLSRYRSVVIWCRRFTVGFAVAPVATPET